MLHSIPLHAQEVELSAAKQTVMLYGTHMTWSIYKISQQELKVLSARWIRPKLGSFHRSSLKSEARRFKKSRPSPMLSESFKVTAPSLYGCWPFVNKLPKVYTDLSTAFYLLHTAIGNGAMNKFGNCSQWRSELLILRMLLFSVCNGAMYAPRYWQRCNERSTLLENVPKMPSVSLRPVKLHNVFLSQSIVFLLSV